MSENCGNECFFFSFSLIPHGSWPFQTGLVCVSLLKLVTDPKISLIFLSMIFLKNSVNSIFQTGLQTYWISALNAQQPWNKATLERVMLHRSSSGSWYKGEKECNYMADVINI